MAIPKVTLKKVVIDMRGALIGFVVEAPASFFGAIGDEIIDYTKTLADLKAMQFCNKQVDMRSGRITELGNFKLNSLPCMVYTDGKLIDIDSSISLTGRFTSGSKVIGYKVRFEGFPGKPEANKRTEEITQLAKWMKPTNFMLRHNYESGKLYLNGKGCSLSDLPETVIGEKKTRKGTDTPVRARNQGQPIQGGVDPSIENTFDILDIYNIIGELNGQVIHFPTEKYEAVSESGTKTEEGFQSSNIGELASPYLDFNSQKLKVNAQFKKLGYVMVNINNRGAAPINTYIHRTKSIFVAGEAHIKRFGVVVSQEKQNELMNRLGKSLAITPYNLGSLASAVSRFGSVPNPVCFSIDASSLSLISKEKAKNSLLTAEEIANLCKKRYEAKIIRKYCNAMMSDIKKELGGKVVSEKVQSKEIYSEFRLYSEDILDALREVGFDIYSGAYSRTSEASNTSDKTSKDKDTGVSIAYFMKEYDDSKKTAAILKKAVKSKDTSVLSENILDLLVGGESISSPFARFTWAEKTARKADRQLASIERQLWMHNATMFKMGSKNLVHTHDAADWIPMPTKATTYEAYQSKKVDGLVLKLSGVRVKNS